MQSVIILSKSIQSWYPLYSQRGPMENKSNRPEFDDVSNASTNKLKVDDHPVFLYKYFPFIAEEHKARVQQILVENRIYIPSPNSFNDPFDCKLEMNYETDGWKNWLLKWLKRQKPTWNRRKRQEVVSNILRTKDPKEVVRVLFAKISDDVGILCFSQSKDNLLLWSHYANSHQGCCLEFNRFTHFLKDVLPVQYETEYPTVNFVSATDLEQATITFLTKAESWSYEKEWRLVEHTNGPGLHIFPPDILTGVIFGCRMSEENRDQIIKWVREGKTSPILYQAAKKKYEFGLDINEL
jgi:hypothetical protein